MKISCIIVEDLQVAADFLMKFCEKSGVLDLKGHFTNVADALVYLNEQTIDLIFLDVEMPGATGFDLLDQLVYSPSVILTTSKTEYAYDAFQYNVTDYMKKPFTYARFLEAIKKVKKAEVNTATIESNDYIFIKADGKLIRLNNDDVLFMESMGDYVKFVTPAKKYVTLNTIKGLEEKVNKTAFLKVHRSFIVNIHKIDDIQDNTLYIKGNYIPISKAHRADVMKKLNIV